MLADFRSRAMTGTTATARFERGAPSTSEPNLTTRKRGVRSAANPWSTSRANGWSTSPIRGGQLSCKRVVKSGRNRALLTSPLLRGVDSVLEADQPNADEG